MRVCLASLHPRILSGQIDSLAGLHLALPTPAFSWLADFIRASCAAPALVSFEGHLANVNQLWGALHRPASLKSYLPLWLVNNGLFGRMSVRLCEAYVVSSDYQRAELIELGVPEARVTVLTNVVEDSKLASCDQPCARRTLGLPAGRSLVGYIGHFNDVKGVDLLAAAFGSLVRQGREVDLALAWSGQGDPRRVEHTLRDVASHVTWLGKVHVGTFLCAIDVLSLPYRSTAGQGAFPSLVLEALHVGRPLVTTDLPLLSEIAGDERVALLCPPERPDALAAQLDRLLSSELLRREMSRQQIRLAHQRFEPAQLAARYEALYTSLIEAVEASVPAAA